MKLEPLKQFICDECGEVIQSIDDGWLEYYENEEGAYGFRIVHHKKASPLRASRKRGCYYQDALTKNLHDQHLKYFMNPAGLALLKSKATVSNVKEVVELICRLTAPYYEEARKYIDTALEDGLVDESNLMEEKSLKQIIDKYSSK